MNITEQRPDAMLVHGYWLSEKSPNKTVGSLRTRLNTRAASLDYQPGTKIVLAAGNIWGNRYPAVAEVMEQELKSKYKVKAADIISIPQAPDTATEIDIFLQLAQEHGWQTLVDIAPQNHQHHSIKHLFTLQGRNDIEYKSTENIILNSNKENKHVKKLVKRLHYSKYEWAYMVYEKLKMHVISDKNYRSLSAKAEKARAKKGSPWPTPLNVMPLLPEIDVFKIQQINGPKKFIQRVTRPLRYAARDNIGKVRHHKLKNAT